MDEQESTQQDPPTNGTPTPEQSEAVREHIEQNNAAQETNNTDKTELEELRAYKTRREQEDAERNNRRETSQVETGTTGEQGETQTGAGTSPEQPAPVQPTQGTVTPASGNTELPRRRGPAFLQRRKTQGA